jgi:hypothetical protein
MVGDSTTTVRVFLSRHPRRYLCRYPLCESPGIGQTRPHFAVLFRVRYGVEVLLVQIVNVFAKILDVHFDLLGIPFEAFALVDGLHQVGICLLSLRQRDTKKKEIRGIHVSVLFIAGSPSSCTSRGKDYMMPHAIVLHDEPQHRMAKLVHLA